MCHDLALVGKMVEQTARGTIRRVNRAEETPGLRKKLSNSSCLQLGKETTTVNHAEMTDETVEVDLFCHDGETRCLLQIEATGTDQVAG